MKSSVSILALCLALFSSSCLSLSGTDLNGADLRYPVSLSQSIIDVNGAHYTPTTVEKVAHFKREWGHWAMFYDSVSLSSDVDLSKLLNEEIERAGGNGIVNLNFSAKGTGWSWLVSLLLIIPEHVKVTVEGDVIKSAAAEL